MQEERSTLNSFPETIDLNQGPFPNNTSIDYPPSWDNMVNPVENRLPNYMFASSDENIRRTNDTNNCGQRFSGWECGESSSSTNNLQDHACSDDPKTRLERSPSFADYFAANARPEDMSFEQPNICSASYVGNQVDGGSLNVQNYNSNRGLLNINSNHEYVRESGRHINLGSGPPHTQYPYSLTDTQHIQNFIASSSHVAPSVGDSSIYLENNETSGPCLSTWGTSCKRKAIEGTTGQSYHGGSSSSDQRMEDMMKHSVGCYTATRDLGITSRPLNLSQLNQPEQLNPSDGIGINRASPAFFPSSRIPTSEQYPATNFSVRLNPERRESDPLETSRGTSARHSSVYASQPLSRPISNTNSLESRSPFALPLNSTNISNIPNQSHSMHLNESRGLPSHPWRESTLLDGGSSSSSIVSGERGSGANARSSYRTSSELPMIVPAPETRSDFHDQIDWSFPPGASASPRHPSSGSRICLSSGGSASSGARLPHPNMALQSSQRSSEVAPWIPFLNIDSDSETQRSHSTLFPSASSSSSSHDAASNSRAQHQPDQRTASFLMDMPGDDTSRRRALATVERRHRLIRQVLNAMRRGVHLPAEDYMLIDPFVNGFVELHDRYRDMRLDVDNMSYEELLALEDRIGNVSTGLDEEKISSSMKQKIYEAITVSPNLEPCCICQEDYVAGDGMGMLDCGHEFHTICIKQWLLLKNLCPVCKTTGLGT